MRDFLMGLGILALTGSAVIALLLAISPAAGRRFQPKWRYWAWLIVALRLAVPLHFSLYRAPVALPVPDEAQFVVERYHELTQNTMQFTLDHPTLDHVSPGPMVDSPVVPIPEAGADETDAPLWRLDVPVEALVLAVWLAGAAFFLAWHIGSYLRFKHKVLRWSAPDGEADGIKVVTCPLLDSPVLMGLFRPVIALPEGLSEGERGFALLHECTHHRRRDLWFKLLTLWVNALYWFSPFLWLLRRQASRDVEIACDADVLRGSDREERRAYGGALLRTVKVTAAPCAALTSQFSGGSRGLKERFRALLDTAPKRSGMLALALVCLLTVAGGVLVGCEAPEPPAEPTPTPTPTGSVLVPENTDVSLHRWTSLPFTVDGKEGEVTLSIQAGILSGKVLLDGETVQTFQSESYSDEVTASTMDINGDGFTDFGYQIDEAGNWRYYVWMDDPEALAAQAPFDVFDSQWGRLVYDPLSERIYGKLATNSTETLYSVYEWQDSYLANVAHVAVTLHDDGTFTMEQETPVWDQRYTEGMTLEDALWPYLPWEDREGLTYARVNYTDCTSTSLSLTILAGDGGEPGARVVWPYAQGVLINGTPYRYSDEDWNRQISSYTCWPLLRSTHYPNNTDVMEVERNADGEIVRLQWRQLPTIPHEDPRVHPVPNS